MIKVGLTGGIGSGKSHICKLFTLLNIPVFNADLEAKKLYDNDIKLKQLLITAFGIQIIDENQIIDKKKIAQIIFNDSNALKIINELIHPRVGDVFEKWLITMKKHPYIIKEAAILFESNSYLEMDQIISVTAPLNIRISRTIKRDLTTSKAIEERIKNQTSDEYKVKRSNYHIENDDKSLVLPQVLAIHTKLLKFGL